MDKLNVQCYKVVAYKYNAACNKRSAEWQNIELTDLRKNDRKETTIRTRCENHKDWCKLRLYLKLLPMPRF